MAVVQKLRDGDAAGARVLFGEIAAGVALLAEGGVLQSIKHILRARGAPAGHCCLPLQPLTPEQEGNRAQRTLPADSRHGWRLTVRIHCHTFNVGTA